MAALAAWLAPRPYLSVVAGAVLILPSLAAGMVSDDYFIGTLGRRMATPAGRRSVWDLFDFADGVPEHNLALIDRGRTAKASSCLATCSRTACR
jgi:hypothetical protein